MDILDAYVTNYIREEILQEALVRNLESFARFLEVAAIMNGQVVNVSGIARDAAVARPTVQGYFGTLVDTLVGIWRPAWRERAKVKEVGRGTGAGRQGQGTVQKLFARLAAGDVLG